MSQTKEEEREQSFRFKMYDIFMASLEQIKKAFIDYRDCKPNSIMTVVFFPRCKCVLWYGETLSEECVTCKAPLWAAEYHIEMENTNPTEKEDDAAEEILARLREIIGQERLEKIESLAYTLTEKQLQNLRDKLVNK